MGLTSRRWANPFLMVVLPLIGAIALSAASARDLYRDALRAIEVQDWQTAIGLLRQAIAEDPEAKVGAFKKYVPHYYLGLSLFELGNCVTALTVWEEAEKQGAITRLNEYTHMQQAQIICQKRIARMEATNDLTEVAGLATDLGGVRDQPEVGDFWNAGSPSWNERFDAAQDLLSASRAVLEKPDNQVTLSQLQEAREQVAAAAAQLDVIQREARKQFKDVQAKREVRSRLIRLAVEEADKVLASTAYLEPFPAKIGKLRGDVEHLIKEASAASDRDSPDELDDMRLELSRAVERLKQASAAPPDKLFQAVRLFLAADHQQVLTLLDGLEFRSGKEAAHAHLLRAASLFHLWAETGLEDSLLGVDARSAVRSCREEDISLVPPRRAFSPRFIEFFFSEGQVRAPIPLD